MPRVTAVLPPPALIGLLRESASRSVSAARDTRETGCRLALRFRLVCTQSKPHGGDALLFPRSENSLVAAELPPPPLHGDNASFSRRDPVALEREGASRRSTRRAPMASPRVDSPPCRYRRQGVGAAVATAAAAGGAVACGGRRSGRRRFTSLNHARPREGGWSPWGPLARRWAMGPRQAMIFWAHGVRVRCLVPLCLCFSIIPVVETPRRIPARTFGRPASASPCHSRPENASRLSRRRKKPRRREKEKGERGLIMSSSRRPYIHEVQRLVHPRDRGAEVYSRVAEPLVR